jgi:very-short-patch-repair endonuclease
VRGFECQRSPPLTLALLADTITCMRGAPHNAVRRARHLRRSQTDAEGLLWVRLRARQLYGAKFRRQQPIGPYVADFCCHEAQLVVELDGSQHAEQIVEDQRRTDDLQSRGFRVLRFWDNQVLSSVDAVLEAIAAALPSTMRAEE